MLVMKNSALKHPCPRQALSRVSIRRGKSSSTRPTKKRTCGECDRYFGSIQEMNFHKKMCRNRFAQQRDEMVAPERIRLIRVAANRQGEYMYA